MTPLSNPFGVSRQIRIKSPNIIPKHIKIRATLHNPFSLNLNGNFWKINYCKLYTWLIYQLPTTTSTEHHTSWIETTSMVKSPKAGFFTCVNLPSGWWNQELNIYNYLTKVYGLVWSSQAHTLLIWYRSLLRWGIYWLHHQCGRRIHPNQARIGWMLRLSISIIALNKYFRELQCELQI